ncbi:MAG: sigma-E processing peptidase SpoIIGA [Bacilli bacterium]
MVVYWDVVTVLNVLFDGLLLFTTACLLQKKVHVMRLVLASVVGGGYVTLLLLFPVDVFDNYIVRLCILLLMVRIAFVYQGIRTYMQQVFLMLVVTLFAGGSLTALHYALLSSDSSFAQMIILLHTEGMPGALNWLYVLIGYPIALFFYVRSQRTWRAFITREAQVVEITIVHESLSHTVRGFVDTGNVVKDPFSQKSVMFMKEQTLVHIYGEPFVYALQQLKMDDVLQAYAGSIVVIPFRSLGEKNGVIAAFEPEIMTVRVNEQQHAITDVLIAPYPNAISIADDVHAIVPPVIVSAMNMDR